MHAMILKYGMVLYFYSGDSAFRSADIPYEVLHSLALENLPRPDQRLHFVPAYSFLSGAFFSLIITHVLGMMGR